MSWPEYVASGPTLVAVGMGGGRTHFVDWATYQHAKVKRDVPALCGISAKAEGEKRWGRRKGGGSAYCNACHAEASRMRATLVG